MKALIDGDLFAYEAGGLTKREPQTDEDDQFPHLEVGDLLPFDVCMGSVDRKIARILEATQADEYVIFLSSPEIQTWRMEAATIRPYKGHRSDKEKPPYWQLIRDNIEMHYNCRVVEFIEADDAMSIEQYADLASCKGVNGRVVAGHMEALGEANTIICTRDKDLNMVPGWHYAWAVGKSVEKGMWWQSKVGGLREFYSQLLTGDATDNILGLFGIGPNAAAVKRVRTCDTEKEMFNNVYKEYSSRFGSYAKQFIVENGQLLWMQQTQEERWNPWNDGRIDEWHEEDVLNAAIEDKELENNE